MDATIWSLTGASVPPQAGHLCQLNPPGLNPGMSAKGYNRFAGLR